jgi:hypothetical protein
MSRIQTRIPNRHLLTRLLWTGSVLAILLLALGAASAQTIWGPGHPPSPPSFRLGGLINDYGPTSISGGPYEMRGPWTLDVHPGSATADFTVVLNMETSDYGMAEATKLDPTVALPDRGAHTHHISMHGTITTDTSHCPTYSPATTGPVIVVMGQPEIITGNGGPAPFQAKGPSTLWICVAGGTQVPFSNVAMIFTAGGATGHFGTQAIHGVVIPEPPHEDHDH